ncbi:MAG: crotonase/enoyl-CoA hydratase family protein [Burkholderiales bacterium]|jgi:enoyl-CoA hydratase/carnithine racemase|nr:crotonase/enoyl-CoA hydratase family protein [Burkholderiales bacterium]
MTWSNDTTRDIRCALKDGILTVRLNRTERMNAFTVNMALELVQMFQHASEDDNVRAVVLTGDGDAFCAGMDLQGEAGSSVFGLNETLRPTMRDLDERLDAPEIEQGVRDIGGRVVLAMFDCKKPLIAAINGVAIGVGATITLACDIRLASSRARFGFVFGKIGIVPDACSSWFLPKVVGLPKALEWTLSGEFIGAEGALNAGLVSELCEPESLLNRAYELANAFTTSRSPVSVALIRQMLYRNASFEHPMQAHKVESLGIFYTSMADGKEGVSAFLNKRQPNYEGLASAMPDFYPWWN